MMTSEGAGQTILPIPEEDVEGEMIVPITAMRNTGKPGKFAGPVKWRPVFFYSLNSAWFPLSTIF